jgi:hypothetical protein
VGRLSAARRNAVALWVEVTACYVANCDAETRRGWGVMSLLRAAVRHAEGRRET